MHEVSFQDKEKEHLTRLQDAEEMKVRPRPPQAPCAPAPASPVLGERGWERSGVAWRGGEGPGLGRMGWRRGAQALCGTAGMSRSRQAAFVRSSPLLGHRARLPPEDALAFPSQTQRPLSLSHFKQQRRT